MAFDRIGSDRHALGQPNPGHHVFVRNAGKDELRQYSIWEAMKAQPKPCPACGGTTHRAGCPIMRKKAIGFGMILGVPLVAVALLTAGPVGLLYLALGCLIAAALVRRRRARDRPDDRDRNARAPDA